MITIRKYKKRVIVTAKNWKAVFNFKTEDAANDAATRARHLQKQGFHCTVILEFLVDLVNGQ